MRIHHFFCFLIILTMSIYFGCEENPAADKELPSVTFISPQADGYYLDTIVVEVSASHSRGISKVEIYVNGATDNTKTFTEAPYRYVFVPSLSEDTVTHTFSAKAYDTEGNVSSTTVMKIGFQSFIPPSDVKLDSISETRAVISWKDNSTMEDQFEIFRSVNEGPFQQVQSVPGNSTTASVEGIYTSGAYFKVRGSKGGKPSKFSALLSVSAFVNTIVPNSIFPLTAGRRLVFSGYFTQSDTETPVSGSNLFYNSSWTIGSPVTPLSAVFGPLATVISASNGGRTTASLILDTVAVNNTGTKRFSPLFFFRDSSSNDHFMLITLGLFYRSAVIKDSATAAGPRKDSLLFIKFASPNARIGGEFIAYERSFVSYSNPAAPTTIKITMKGKWESKQNIFVNGVQYSTYYLIVSRIAWVGTAVVSSGITGKFWFADGIGPVKMFLAGDSEHSGEYKELLSKNF